MPKRPFRVKTCDERTTNRITALATRLHGAELEDVEQFILQAVLIDGHWFERLDHLEGLLFPPYDDQVDAGNHQHRERGGGA